MIDNRTDLLEMRDSLQKQRTNHRRRLRLLREEESKYGSVGVPIHMQLDIEDTTEKIERLTLELEGLNEKIANLPPKDEDNLPPTTLSATEETLHVEVAPTRPELTLAAGDATVVIPPEILKPLQEALAQGTLVLFIGSDLPQTVTGLPSRADLARKLAAEYHLADILSLAEVTQRVMQAKNRWAFTDFLRTELETFSKSPTTFHQQVVTLVNQKQIETIITTAYDDLLETAFKEAKVRFNRVVSEEDVKLITPHRPTLFKFYGDTQQPDSLVVTDQDHTDLLHDTTKQGLLGEVRRAFNRYTVLFLGYNLADPDFRFIFDAFAQSQFSIPAYAVWPNLPEADITMWRDRNVIISEGDLLGALLGTLVEG